MRASSQPSHDIYNISFLRDVRSAVTTGHKPRSSEEIAFGDEPNRDVKSLRFASGPKFRVYGPPAVFVCKIRHCYRDGLTLVHRELGITHALDLPNRRVLPVNR